MSVDDLKRLTDVNDVLLRYLLRLQLTLIINLLVIFSIYYFVYKNVRKQWKYLKDYVFKSLILSDDNDHSITFEKLNPA